MIVVTPSLKK